MVERRSQGRPCRGGNEVGKVRIVESLRELFRLRGDAKVSRKCLATFAGVTPALITYYFPCKYALLEEAVRPVLEAHARDLNTLLSSDDESELVLRRAVRFIFEFHKRDAVLFEVYGDLLRNGECQGLPDYIGLMSEQMSNFLANWQVRSPRQSLMLQGALWGMCKFVIDATRQSAHDEILDDEDDVTPIFEVFAGALRLSTSRVAKSA